jgi:hypothetical protein
LSKVLYYIKFFASGLDAANDFGKENGPLAGIAAAPFIVGANIIAGPFRGIKKVGDVMIGKKKKK